MVGENALPATSSALVDVVGESIDPGESVSGPRARVGASLSEPCSPSNAIRTCLTSSAPWFSGGSKTRTAATRRSMASGTASPSAVRNKLLHPKEETEN